MTNDDKLTADERAQANYKTQSKIYESVARETGDVEYAELDKSQLLGQNMLRYEIGYFGEWDGTNYKFEDTRRDRLLAHTRQDVASAYGIGRSNFRAIWEVRRIARRLLQIGVLLVILNIALLVGLFLK